MDPPIEIREEIRQALKEQRPVVALESAILSHGMPYPRNVQTAREVEAEIRQHGAVPATIGLLEGRIRVGLSGDELEWFGRSKGVRKVSGRDIPAVLASGDAGATTVAATMRIAGLAHIRIQVTGGIGGVHRGGENSLDVSADLTELSRTPVAVVCSGAKAVLDIGRTLEVLETLGVPVVGYRTSQFPAFFCRTSGHDLEHHVESAEEAAMILRRAWELPACGGVLLVNPVPAPEALGAEEVERYLTTALEEARLRGVAGKSVTPFLLSRLTELSAGRTLGANVAAVLDNARVGALVAAAAFP